jgi:tryptophan-rich sensory protein
VTTTQRRQTRRRLDLANFILLLASIASGIGAYVLLSTSEVSALVLVPSAIAAAIAATHLTKYEAPRE